MALDYCSVIEGESTRLVAALEANRDGKIPWSDRWTVATCAKHVGGAHHVVAKVIENRPTANFELFATLDTPDRSDPNLATWVADGTASLVTQLRATDPAAECWSWHPEGRSAGFWARRMAHDTLVHRWDAEAGAGTAGAAMDPAVAADGIDEYLDVFVAVTRGLRSSPAGPSFHYECTDTDDNWFLQLPSEGARVVTREPVECAVHLRGPAEGLLLVAWGRLRPDIAGVKVLGDTHILSRWNELLPPM